MIFFTLKSQVSEDFFHSALDSDRDVTVETGFLPNVISQRGFYRFNIDSPYIFELDGTKFTYIQHHRIDYLDSTKIIIFKAQHKKKPYYDLSDMNEDDPYFSVPDLLKNYNILAIRQEPNGICTLYFLAKFYNQICFAAMNLAEDILTLSEMKPLNLDFATNNTTDLVPIISRDLGNGCFEKLIFYHVPHEFGACRHKKVDDHNNLPNEFKVYTLLWVEQDEIIQYREFFHCDCIEIDQT